MCSTQRLFVVAALLLAAAAGALTAGSADGRADDGRTVIDNERGGYFMYPHAGDWAALGADFGLRVPRYRYDDMDAEATKGAHGRLQHFEPEDEHMYAYFPYSLLKEYEADEIAQGRAPLSATATFEGKQRPVLWAWHWNSSLGKLEAQPLNIGDDRYIKFFIKQYCRGVMMDPYRPTWWVGLDNASFTYDGYGVLNDAREYVPDPVPWDEPFAQNAQEWMDAAAYCFGRVREWAPDVRLITNEGSQPDEAQYARIFGEVPGVILEGALGTQPWARGHFHTMVFPRLSGPDKDKVQIFQFRIGDRGESRLRASYAAYLICRGPNAFFGPIGTESTEVDPAEYAAMKNALGRPVAPAESAHESGADPQFNLYWRECDGGLAYLNLTGAEKTVQLPPATWFDRAGNRVASLTIPDYGGDFALRDPRPRAARPQINPRRPEPVTGPLAITMTTEPWTSGAAIHYTLDGGEPTANSPLYTGPLALAQSCLVRAKAFKEGMSPSFTASAAYTITDELPEVSFHLAADEGSEFLDDYPLLELSHLSTKEIQVKLGIAGGTATPGADYNLIKWDVEPILFFPPGERYRSFHLPILNDRTREGDETIVLTLSDPVNATLGAQTTYTYTIEDND